MRPIRFRLSNLSIRTRIVVLTLPLMLGVSFTTGMILADRYQQVRGMRQAAALTRFAVDISALVHELQKERAASGVFAGSNGESFKSELEQQRRLTDARRAAFENTAAGMTAERIGADVAGRVAGALDAFRQLDATRARVSGLTISAADSTAWFTATIGAMLKVVPGFVSIINHPDIPRSLLSYSNLIQGKERAGQERAAGLLGLALGRFTPELLARVTRLANEQDTLFQAFDLSADAVQVALLHDALASSTSINVIRDREIILHAGERGDLAGLTAAGWFAAATARIDLLKRVEDQISDRMLATAQRTRDRAFWDFCATLGIAGVLLAGNTLVAWAVARSIVRPVTAMTRAMATLAAGDTSIEVPAREQTDQIGDMARAVVVFKNSLIETGRLTQAQSLARQHADADKRAALVGMIERIELETNGALGQVTTCADAMTRMANEMTGSAGLYRRLRARRRRRRHRCVGQRAVRGERGGTTGGIDPRDQCAGAPIDGSGRRGGGSRRRNPCDDRGVERGGRAYRRGRRHDPRDRRQNQSAGAERDDRSGAGGRGRQRFRGRRR